MSIEISEERGVRFLHFGSPWIQGAMRISRPWSLELEYTRDLMAPLLLRGGPEWPERVLQIGLGAASITRFLYRHRPAAKLTVVEIDPEVIAAARHHFRLPEENPQLRIVVADGHEHVAMKDRKYDLIVVDGYDYRGRAGWARASSACGARSMAACWCCRLRRPGTPWCWLPKAMR